MGEWWEFAGDLLGTGALRETVVDVIDAAYDEDGFYAGLAKKHGNDAPIINMMVENGIFHGSVATSLISETWEAISPDSYKEFREGAHKYRHTITAAVSCVPGKVGVYTGVGDGIWQYLEAIENTAAYHLSAKEYVVSEDFEINGVLYKKGDIVEIKDQEKLVYAVEHAAGGTISIALAIPGARQLKTASNGGKIAQVTAEHTGGEVAEKVFDSGAKDVTQYMMKQTGLGMNNKLLQEGLEKGTIKEMLQGAKPGAGKAVAKDMSKKIVEKGVVEGGKQMSKEELSAAIKASAESAAKSTVENASKSEVIQFAKANNWLKNTKLNNMPIDKAVKEISESQLRHLRKLMKDSLTKHIEKELTNKLVHTGAKLNTQITAEATIKYAPHLFKFGRLAGGVDGAGEVGVTSALMADDIVGNEWGNGSHIHRYAEWRSGVYNDEKQQAYNPYFVKPLQNNTEEEK